MITESKPGSPAEVLEHHGTKGMKWGVRSRRDTSKAPKAPQKGIALGRSSREFRAQHPTAKLQAKAIMRARVESRKREKAIRQMKKKDSVEAAKMLRDHMNNPGTAIALRSTRGEKVVDLVLLGGVRNKGFVGDVSAISTAMTLGTAAARRNIERKQRRGGYK